MFRVIIAQLRLLDLEMSVSVVPSWFYLALMQNKLLLFFYFKEFPVRPSLAEAAEDMTNLNVARDDIKFDEALSSSIYFLAFDMELANEVTMVNNLFIDSFVSSVEKFADCGFNVADWNSAFAGGIEDLEEQFLSIFMRWGLHSKKY